MTPLSRFLLLASLTLLALPGHAVDGDFVETATNITPAAATNGDGAGQAFALVPDAFGAGVDALAIGRPGEDAPSFNEGAVDLVQLNADGTVTTMITIDAADPVLTIAGGDAFGSDIATLGDLSGDGTIEIAVGSPDSAENGNRSGSVHIVSLTAGTAVPSAATKIASAWASPPSTRSRANTATT